MDINQILSEVGIVVPEEKVQQFNKLVRTSYKSVAEVNKLRGDIDSLKEQITELESAKANLTEESKESTSTTDKQKEEIAKLTAQVNEYESKFKDIELTKAIKECFKDKKFISKRVEDSVINEIKGKYELKDGKIEGIEDYIKGLDSEQNIFESEVKQVYMHTNNNSKSEPASESPFLSALYKDIESSNKNKE